MQACIPSLLVQYPVVLEFDPETRHYTASVPGLPVVVDATSRRAALKLAREAIACYLKDSGAAAAPPLRAELVTVKV